MIELKDYPTVEEYLDAIQRCTAVAREALNDIEYLSKKYVTGEFYMIEDEVAEFLRTDIESIPKMTWYRTYKGGKLVKLYKKADVIDYLESKRCGKK